MSRNFYNLTLRNLQIQAVNLYLGCNFDYDYYPKCYAWVQSGARGGVLLTGGIWSQPVVEMQLS